MAKKAKAAKKAAGPRAKPKTKSNAPGAPAAPMDGSPAKGSVPGDNAKGSRLSFAEEQSLFVRHREAWNRLQAKQKALDEQFIQVKSEIKADGFKVLHMQIADDLATVKGELRVSAAVEDRLRVARWIGHAMGAQMDLFEKRSGAALGDEAAVQRHRASGRVASAENKPRKPPKELAPGSREYDAWMQGFGDHQEEMMASGFKKPAATESDEVETESGERISRTEWKRRMGELTDAGDKVAKSNLN